MSRLTIILITLFIAFTLTACGQGKSTSGSGVSLEPAEAGSHPDAGSPSEAEQRISFDINDTREGAYTDHVAELWEQTKTLLREDLYAKYTDGEYQELGKPIEYAWTNLQAHASLEHAEEVEAADENVAYANVIGKIKDLIWTVYDISGGETPEKRNEKRAELRDGGLERRIEKIDKIIYSESEKTPLTEKDFMGVWGIQLTTDKSMLLVNDKQYDSGIAYTGTANGIEYAGVIYPRGVYRKFGGVACFLDTDDSPGEVTIRIMEKDHSGPVLKAITLKSGESVPFEIDIPQIESLYIRNTSTDRVPTGTIPEIMMIADPYFK
jgi:hypothetical protein